MANNRMFLQCKKCRGLIFLAKYYPHTGWASPFNGELDHQFEDHEVCSAFDLENEQFELKYELSMTAQEWKDAWHEAEPST